MESKDFSIKIDHLNDDALSYKVRRNEEVLNLLMLYNTHKEYVKKLFRCNYIYSESYKTVLLSSFSDVFRDDKDILFTIIPSYMEKKLWGQAPPAKLTYDVINGDVGIHKK